MTYILSLYSMIDVIDFKDTVSTYPVNIACNIIGIGSVSFITGVAGFVDRVCTYTSDDSVSFTNMWSIFSMVAFVHFRDLASTYTNVAVNNIGVLSIYFISGVADFIVRRPIYSISDVGGFIIVLSLYCVIDVVDFKYSVYVPS